MYLLTSYTTSFVTPRKSVCQLTYETTHPPECESGSIYCDSFTLTAMMSIISAPSFSTHHPVHGKIENIELKSQEETKRLMFLSYIDTSTVSYFVLQMNKFVTFMYLE